MIWAHDGTPVTPRRRGGPPRRGAPTWRRCCGCATRPASRVTAAAGRSGVCGASMPVHGGIVLDLTAITGIVHVDAAALVLDVRAGTFGTPLEADLRDAPRSHPRALAAVDRPLHRRRLAGVPQRGTAVDALREDRGHGARPRRRARRRSHRAHRRRAARRGGPRPQPGVRRQRRHPRGDHRCASARAPGTRRGGTGRVPLHRVRRRARRVPPHPAARRDPGGAPVVRRHRGRPALLDRRRRHHAPRARRRRSRDRRRGAAGRAGGVRGRDRRTIPRSSTSGWSGATTSPRSGTSSRTGTSSTPWRSRPRGRCFPASTTGCSLRCGASRAWCWRRPTSRTPTPTARACTSPSVVIRRSSSVRSSTAPRGTPAWTATLAGGAALSHHHGIGLNRGRYARAALGDAFDVLVATKSALDPHGILNPGKLGLPHPWGEPAWP